MPLWILYALLGAAFAAVIPIFAKLGLAGMDTTLATGLRAWVAALFLAMMLTALGKWQELPRTTPAMAGFILASGLAGAASWVFNFLALREGPAGPAQALDRMSLVMTLVLAALFLGERLTGRVLMGGALMVAGAILIASAPKR